jgi:hypothetical protein
MVERRLLISFDPVETPFRLLFESESFVKDASLVVTGDEDVDPLPLILTEDMAKQS